MYRKETTKVVNVSRINGCEPRKQHHKIHYFIHQDFSCHMEEEFSSVCSYQFMTGSCVICVIDGSG